MSQTSPASTSPDDARVTRMLADVVSAPFWLDRDGAGLGDAQPPIW